MLRSGRVARRPRSRLARGERSPSPGPPACTSRPVAQAADRAVPGHWEGDLIIGARGTSAIITLV
ncbi:hypothetical protein GCM10009736_52910 [Actinomadura bangladeshensis]